MSSRRKVVKRPAASRPAIKGRGAYRPKGRAVRPYIKGRGDYTKGYGARLGGVVGEGLHMLYDRINPLALLGFGDYIPAPFAQNIKKNSLNTLAMGHDPPQVINSSGGNVIVRHREYLTDITTGAAGVFTNRSWSINPGVQECFPWLSSMAQCFEQYNIRGMVFEFKSTSADALNSTNTALGSVIMATEYDATRPDFSTKQQMENHQYAQSARQSCSMLHPIECARPDNVLTNMYVRNGADTGQDLRFCDFGKFQLATVGQQGSSVVIGELWVSYEVELLKPRMPALEGGASVYSLHGRASSGISTSAYFGTTMLQSGNLPVAVSTNKITFPDWIDQGWFLVNYVVYGSSSVVSGVSVSATNATITTIWNNNTQTGFGDAGTDTTLSNGFIIDVNGPGPSFTFSGGTLPTSPTQLDLIITSYNPGASFSTQAKVEEVHDDDEAEEKKPEQKALEAKSDDDIVSRLRELGLTSADPERIKEYRLIASLARHNPKL